MARIVTVCWRILKLGRGKMVMAAGYRYLARLLLCSRE
jgi:hypothetical protein